MRLAEAEAKRKAAAAAAAEWMAKSIISPKEKKTGPREQGEAFRRVDDQFWGKQIKQGLEDNSYEAAFGSTGVGSKAQAKLFSVRGKDFTKGKNKLKKSTYMCGKISLNSNSVKYAE